MPAMSVDRDRLRRRHRRHRRPPERRPGRASATDPPTASAPPTRAAGRAAPGDERRRRHRRGAGPHHRRAARRRRPRRLGDADRDEEGPAGAHRRTCSATPPCGARSARLLVAETGSLGLRGPTWSAGRSTAKARTVDVGGHPVRVKVAAGRVKVEHDDALRVAQRAGLPLREVLSLAEEAARRVQDVVELRATAADDPPDDEPA